MNEDRLFRIEEDISEIKKSQETIIRALLGNINDKSVGIIEETRTLKRDVEELHQQTEENTAQIKGLDEFKGNTKKIFWAAGLSLPLLWELIKFLASSTFDVFRGK